MSDTNFDRALDDVVQEHSKKNARKNFTNNRAGITRGASYNLRGTSKFQTRGSFRGGYRGRGSSVGPIRNHNNNSYNMYNTASTRGAPHYRGQYLGGARGRGIIRGGSRPAPYHIPNTKSNPNYYNQNNDNSNDDGGLTRVLISNLDSNTVSLDDIKELYSEFGRYKRMVLNYDKAGRSLGTAEIVYERRGDALKAMQTYNGVPLDGKTMCVEVVSNNMSVVRKPVVGSNRLGQPRGRPNNYRPNGYAVSYAHATRMDYDNPRNNKGNTFVKPKFIPNKTPQKPVKSAEDLDKELDKYLMAREI